MKIKNKEKIYCIVAILLMIDQFIKLIIKNNLKLFEEIKVIPKFFSIYYLENDGAAFSILGGRTFILIIVGIIALILFDKFISNNDKLSNVEVISFGMVMAGIVGNLIDRCLYGSVIDYLSFNIFNYNFPVFNFADICITIGALLMLIDIMRRDLYDRSKRRRNKNR